jgi:hypothetical protein
VKENDKGIFPDKYEMFTAGTDSDLFTGINSIVLESTIKDFSGISQGRYIREFAYVLLALDFAEDLSSKKISDIKIDSLNKIEKKEFFPFVQSRESRYAATKTAVKFSKLKFASEGWRKILSGQILTYGYFCRYLDVIDLLQLTVKNLLKREEISLSALKNLIGPFDSRVQGSGPDFIQETFKTWAFMLNIIDIRTEGKLDAYNLSKKLKYLKKHTGYITDGTGAYRILGNLKRAWIVRKEDIPREVRIASFMRLVNLELWRRNFDKAIFTSLRRLRLLFMFNKMKGATSLENIVEDNKMKEIGNCFGDYHLNDLLDDLLFIESTGIKLETETESKYLSLTGYLLSEIIRKEGIDFLKKLENVDTKNIFYEHVTKICPELNTRKIKVYSNRKFDVKGFEKYLPTGKVIEWIKKN